MTTSTQLTNNISAATGGVTNAVTGTLDVIQITGLTFSDVGLTTPLVARGNSLRKAYVVNFTKAKTPQKTPQVVVIKLW